MNLRPGIKEAVEVFWNHLNAIIPPVVSEKRYVNEALLLALCQLNVIRDENERELLSRMRQ